MNCTLFFFNGFVYFWLHWVFVVALGLFSNCGKWAYSLVGCLGLLRWLLLLQSTGFRMREFSCPTACGIFLEQGWNHVPCIGRQNLKHWTTREVLSFTILNFGCFLGQFLGEIRRELMYNGFILLSYKDVSFLSFISVNRLSLKILNIV